MGYCGGMGAALRIRRVSAAAAGGLDPLVAAVGSPWQSAGFARAYSGPGVRAVHLAAVRGSVVAGAAVLFFAGSRRAGGLDRALGTLAFLLDEPAAADDEAAWALLAAAERAARRAGAVELDLRVQWPRRFDRAGLLVRGFAVRVAGAGVRELPAEEAGIEAGMKPMARKQIRKAQRAGVTVGPGDLPRLLPLLDRSFDRSGAALRDHEFVRRLAGQADGRILVATHEGRDLAALLLVGRGTTVVNAFHGRADGEIHGASHLLHRELFLLAGRAGARRVHTGGMALPGETDEKLLGITRFKESLGFTAIESFRATKILRPAARKLRTAALALYRRAKGAGA